MLSRKNRKLELSLPARDDLRDIAHYTIINYGEKQMDRYLASLHQGMMLLTENPRISRRRNDLPAG